MSGDVQPRKRKDKKKKKDELSLEEPRGTAAALGEGDVFMHSQHDHGTGGHWCAKIIFFSLLAVLITLIGLIILENRGLSELEANAVESRYSGILEGWLEDAPDDDHHDEHTLELKHHDEEEHEEDEADDEEIEVERIEKEASEEEPISTELPALPEEDDDDDDDHKEDNDDDDAEADNDSHEDEDENEAEGEDAVDDDFLEADDEPVVERITAPAGKPFVEVEEDETSSEQPPQTLEEEEEYEKQQEDLRREEEQSSSHIWLKLVIGGALLAATHAVMSRATAPRDEPEEEREIREETPVDRRMTLIPEETPIPVIQKKVQQSKKAVEEIVRKATPVVQAAPAKEESEEEEVEEPEEIEVEEMEDPKKDEKDKELYSDEEEEEEEVVQKKEAPKPTVQKPQPKPIPEPEPEDEDPDDVEIIDDEQLEEELEEEEDDVSDVDDAELLSRLEAKYGRLPEPDRPAPKHKDGGNSIDDDWPGEPSDAFWRQQLDSAEQNLRQGEWTAALERLSVAELRPSGRARYLVATALDRMAEAKRDNGLLSRAIVAYLDVLKMNEHLPDKKLLQVAQRALDRIQFRGNYLNAEPVYRLLIRRFPNEPAYRNNLTISFLMANRVDLAEDVLKETLARWPNDRVALAHYAFVLKTQQNKLEEAVEMFQKALKGDKGPACEPRFYYHYGDALLLLGRYKEAHEVHKRGAKYGHFLSPAQRSLYNVARLRGRPWWNVADTPYTKLAKALEKAWKDILMEGQAAKTLYEQEKEGLKERGEWSQMDLFVRGQEIPGRCKRAPVTCSIIRAEPAAAGCRRGQIKFSAMEPGTHVRPHVGPTNCRLRMHLGLSNTKDTYIRVDQETRQWQEGKVLLFDDSFEHEVWHNGTGKRLVLIVDVWHPDLTAAERRSLPAI
ncbi:aspartyl/asparaginyl beta-hydroxylase isoform X2 [Pectinophora gossypiella]|nr:aspartyl/asparaginyl beta-hydroxylase isoform X2 [Pectinophora gossypiella]